MARKLSYVLLLATIVLMTGSKVFAADTQRISALMAGSVNKTPTASDNSIIDGFISEAMNELLASRTISEGVQVRSQIVQYRGWDVNLAQYTRSYILAAKKHLERAFDQLSRLTNPETQLSIERNLIVLVAQLGSVELRDFALPRLDHADSTVRYWAVRSLTNRFVAEELSSSLTANPDAARSILQALAERVEKEIQPEILSRMAGFAAQLKMSEATDLLITIAETRMKAYENWNVQSERAETGILEALATATKFAGSTGEKTQLARAFSQLYSYVVQRYILGEQILPDKVKGQLKSTILEVEYSALRDLLETAAANLFFQALSERGAITMQQAHDDYFGTASKAGQLGTKLTFQYQLNPNGQMSNGPKPLKAPPPTLAATTPEGS
ncbi:MAG: hypothetical protein JXA82_05215 [Sedimentisphaerales bacterium]|nr:hypothetical protein [Sedimentisphaerales bacterium]